jgi:hypothetical protein
MPIAEIGRSVQVRIEFEDAEKLRKLKLKPEEAWYEVIHRVLIDYENLKKQRKKELI